MPIKEEHVRPVGVDEMDAAAGEIKRRRSGKFPAQIPVPAGRIAGGFISFGMMDFGRWTLDAFIFVEVSPLPFAGDAAQLVSQPFAVLAIGVQIIISGRGIGLKPDLFRTEPAERINPPLAG